MPTYEYHCEANGALIEVHHKMAEVLKTWGELCGRAGISLGMTDPGSPVQKLMSASFIGTGTTSASSSVCEAPACGSGACGSRMCALE